MKTSKTVFVKKKVKAMLEQIASAINAERRLKRCRQHGKERKGGGEAVMRSRRYERISA